MATSEHHFAKPYWQWGFIVRLVFGLVALLCCYRLVIASGRSGAARFLNMLSIIQSSVEPADRAITVSPDDPEAHYTRALALVNVERLNEAVGELQQAIKLRPH